jgi:hypothetical protein
MEKNGEIREGVTPPEVIDQDERFKRAIDEASGRPGEDDALDGHMTKRAMHTALKAMQR